MNENRVTPARRRGAPVGLSLSCPSRKDSVTPARRRGAPVGLSLSRPSRKDSVIPAKAGNQTFSAKTQVKTLIIGLTGSIGMGKSTTLKLLAKEGLPTYSADEAVHDLLAENGKAVKKLAKHFPHSLKNNAIDRDILGAEVFKAPEKLKLLESIIHPLVSRQAKAAVVEAKRNKAPAIILDIPLLFETGGDKNCDVIICVSSTMANQRKRVMARKGMTPQKFKGIMAKQMPNKEKIARSDYVINTDKGIPAARKQVRAILKLMTGAN